MRFILIACFSLFLTTGFGQTKNLVTERILYTVRFDDSSGKDKGHYQHLDSKTKNKLIDQICDLVYEGKLPINTYWGETVAELPREGGFYAYNPNKRFKKNDSLTQHLDTANLNRDFDISIYRYLLNSLSFLEKWFYNSETNQFSKEVNGVILFHDRVPQYRRFTSDYVPFNDSTKNYYDEKNLLVRNIIYDVEVSRNEQNKTEEFNWWLNFLEPSRREKLFTIFTRKALKDSTEKRYLNRFYPDYPFAKIYPENDNIYYGRFHEEHNNCFQNRTKEFLMAHFFELEDWTTVRKLRFHENWYFDAEELRFEKKVLGIGMIVDKYNEEGKVIGDTCLVYYKMNP